MKPAPLITLLTCIATTAAAQPRFADSPFAERSAYWREAMKSLGVPGFAVVVVKDGEVVLLDAMGRRDSAGNAVDPDTMFYIASCTKAYNAFAAVALAEDGKLDLDRPVKAYLPELRLPDEELTRSLTPRDLLCHRHGINNGDIVFNDAYSGLISDPLYFRLLAEADIAREVAYTNVHFTLLGRVIGAVTGQDWRDALDERVLKPAGMTRTTGYASRMYADDNAAIPMIRIRGEFQASPLRKTDRTMHAAGGLGTTARDAGRWLLLNLNGGEIDGRRVVSEAGARAMQAFQSKLPEPSGSIRVRQGFGLGWGVGEYRGRKPYCYHGGGYVGAAAYMSFLPEEGIGMAILANASGSGHGLTDIVAVDVYDVLLGLEPPTLLPGYQERADRMHARLDGLPAGENPARSGDLTLAVERYVGRYAHDDYGVLEVRLDAGDLHSELGDLAFALRATGADAFEASFAPGSAFDGRFELQDGGVAAVILAEGDDEYRFIRQ